MLKPKFITMKVFNVCKVIHVLIMFNNKSVTVKLSAEVGEVLVKNFILDLRSFTVTEFIEFLGREEFWITFIFDRIQLPNEATNSCFFIPFGKIRREHIFVFMKLWFKEFARITIMNERGYIFSDIFNGHRIENYNR